MFSATHISYLYDGSFEGFLCCVFESYEKREAPISICAENGAPLSLWNEKYVATDLVKAERVYHSMAGKISKYAQQLVGDSFLTCLDNKELHILEFLYLGYQLGGKVTDLLTDPRVEVLVKAVGHLSREAHHLLGFARFSVYDDHMVSIIEPKNYVLPKIVGHFCNRYNSCDFLIYDKTHQVALIYANGVATFREIEGLTLPPMDENERSYQELWKAFYTTIAIEGRKNHRCRMNMMPKRYWKNMPEVRDER